ncbi:MAG: hypothetical protein LHW46_07845 [Candidatus Cloacimonetes bacterium]|nr:hypothetical protein [Candidatus Cloacimonadota bacterium]MDD3577847.1 hypothetical protein [Candidatus Cloacimonadota bacterium]MDD4667284.1 hypothetical protein [Candidatus Cloacimonadota bacterium]
MIRILICLTALMMLFIGACFSENELVVKNNSTGEAWIRIDSGAERYIPPGSTRSFGVSGPNDVAILYHGDHIWPGVLYVDMNLGGGQSVTLEPNCGALRLRNTSTRSIREAYLSQAGTNDWGSNILQSNLPGGSSRLLSLNPAYWDLKIQDQHFNYYYYTGLLVQQDQTRQLSFNP